MQAQKWLAVALLGACSNDAPTPAPTPTSKGKLDVPLAPGGHRLDNFARIDEYPDCHRTTEYGPFAPPAMTLSHADWHATLRGRASGEVYAIVYGFWTFGDDRTGEHEREVERCLRVVPMPERHASYAFELSHAVVNDGGASIEPVIPADSVLDIKISMGEAGETFAVARIGWHFTFQHGVVHVTGLATAHATAETNANGVDVILDGTFAPAIREVGIDSVDGVVNTSTSQRPPPVEPPATPPSR